MGYIIYNEGPKLHAEATSQQAGRRHDLEILAFRDAEPRLDRRPLVKGVLQHQQASMIVGETGCGKTFLALDLSLHVAAGLEWFGRKVDQGAVVYLAAKADRGIVDRIAAFKYAHSLQDKDLLFVAVTSPIDLWNAGVGNVDRISEAISEVALGKTVLLVIDTDYRALARGGENNAANIDVFVRSMYRLRYELQCHVLVVHTFGRSKAVDAHVRHLLRCAVDTELEVTRGVKTGVSTVTVNKQRDDRTGDQFEFELAQIELGRNQDGDPVTSCVIRRRVGRSMTKAKGSPVSSVQVKWSPVQQQVFNKLIEAITQAGEILPWNDHIPAEIPCVHVKVWRKLAYTGPISSSPNLDTKRKAFQRASEELIEAGWVGKWGNLVWLVQGPDKLTN